MFYIIQSLAVDRWYLSVSRLLPLEYYSIPFPTSTNSSEANAIIRLYHPLNYLLQPSTDLFNDPLYQWDILAFGLLFFSPLEYIINIICGHVKIHGDILFTGACDR